METYQGRNLEILEWPHATLETRADEILHFTEETIALADAMHRMMQESNGIGLAANQVGVLERMIAIEISYSANRYEDDEEAPPKAWWHNQKFTLVNPKIVKKKGKISWQEGCLSFPEIFEFVDRAAEVWIEYQDEHGAQKELHADGLFSVCIQHEIDHIDGIVFMKRMSRLKSSMVRKKMLARAQQSFRV